MFFSIPVRKSAVYNPKPSISRPLTGYRGLNIEANAALPHLIRHQEVDLSLGMINPLSSTASNVYLGSYQEKNTLKSGHYIDAVRPNTSTNSNRGRKLPQSQSFIRPTTSIGNGSGGHLNRSLKNNYNEISNTLPLIDVVSSPHRPQTANNSNTHNNLFIKDSPSILSENTLKVVTEYNNYQLEPFTENKGMGGDYKEESSSSLHVDARNYGGFAATAAYLRSQHVIELRNLHESNELSSTTISNNKLIKNIPSNTASSNVSNTEISMTKNMKSKFIEQTLIVPNKSPVIEKRINDFSISLAEAAFGVREDGCNRSPLNTKRKYNKNNTLPRSSNDEIKETKLNDSDINLTNKLQLNSFGEVNIFEQNEMSHSINKLKIGEVGFENSEVLGSLNEGNSDVEGSFERQRYGRLITL